MTSVLFSKNTVRLRHLLVRLMAPKLYENACVASRPMIDFVYKNLKDKQLMGVEVGVAFGDNAENMLKTLKLKKLYLVDPYVPYVEDGKRWNYMPIEEDGRSWNYSKAMFLMKKRLQKFQDRITFLRMTSEEAIQLIPDNMDFVYIDGNHAYEYIKRDIQLYYPKVKEGGVIGGHDFTDHFGVMKAVIQFVESQGLRLNVRQKDWWIVKNYVNSTAHVGIDQQVVLYS